MFNDDGYVAVCEADAHSAFTMPRVAAEDSREYLYGYR